MEGKKFRLEVSKIVTHLHCGSDYTTLDWLPLYSCETMREAIDMFLQYYRDEQLNNCLVITLSIQTDEEYISINIGRSSLYGVLYSPDEYERIFNKYKEAEWFDRQAYKRLLVFASLI